MPALKNNAGSRLVVEQLEACAHKTRIGASLRLCAGAVAAFS
jgi:hypothetical protein